MIVRSAMPWVFYYQKIKWEEFDEWTNDLINEALSQDHPPKEVSFVHWWGAGKKQPTEYVHGELGNIEAEAGQWDHSRSHGSLGP